MDEFVFSPSWMKQNIEYPLMNITYPKAVLRQLVTNLSTVLNQGLRWQDKSLWDAETLGRRASMSTLRKGLLKGTLAGKGSRSAINPYFCWKLLLLRCSTWYTAFSWRRDTEPCMWRRPRQWSITTSTRRGVSSRPSFGGGCLPTLLIGGSPGILGPKIELRDLVTGPSNRMDGKICSARRMTLHWRNMQAEYFLWVMKKKQGPT